MQARARHHDMRADRKINQQLPLGGEDAVIGVKEHEGSRQRIAGRVQPLPLKPRLE